jgi:hypothetical protein
LVADRDAIMQNLTDALHEPPSSDLQNPKLRVDQNLTIDRFGECDIRPDQRSSVCNRELIQLSTSVTRDQFGTVKNGGATIQSQRGFYLETAVLIPQRHGFRL